MILTIPYTELHPSNIVIGSKTTDRRDRILYPLRYSNELIHLSDLAIMSSPLLFHSYDAITGRLVFDCSKPEHKGFIGKFVALQKSIKNTLMPELSREQVADMLQILYYNKTLTLYTFPSTPVQTRSGEIQSVTDLRAGCSVRIALRLYGVMRLDYKGLPQLRFQHSIPSMWLCD